MVIQYFEGPIGAHRVLFPPVNLYFPRLAHGSAQGINLTVVRTVAEVAFVLIHIGATVIPGIIQALGNHSAQAVGVIAVTRGDEFTPDVAADGLFFRFANLNNNVGQHFPEGAGLVIGQHHLTPHAA